MLRTPGGAAFRLMALVTMVAAVMGACGDGRDRPIDSTRTSIVPIPPRGVTDSAWRAAVVAYASTLAFDTLVPATDTATHIDGIDTTRVTISPLAVAGSIPDSALHAGWIIGRTVGYGPNLPLGIPIGIGYVWVDSVDGAWRAIHIPDNPADSLRFQPVVFGNRPFLVTEPARAIYVRALFILNLRCGPRCCIEGGNGRDDDARKAIVDSMHSAAIPRDAPATTRP